MNEPEYLYPELMKNFEEPLELLPNPKLFSSLQI